MSRKQFIVLVLLVLVIGGAGIAVFQRDTESWKGPDARLGKKVLPDLQVSDITQIHIKHAKEELNLALNDKGTWVVQERGGFPADPALISELTFKAREWKIVQSEPIGEAQRARMEVAAPDAAEGASTLLEFRGKDGKALATLFLGKKKLGKPPLQVKGFDKGQPEGRYLLVGADPKTLLLVQDPMNNVEPKPEKWIAKDFVKVDRIRKLVVETPGTTISYQLSRDQEAGDWVLAGLRPGEKTDPSAAVSATNAFYALAFSDIAMDVKPEQLNRATTITADTFDGWTYVMRVAPRPNDDANVLFSVAVSGEAKPTERVPVKDEKPEEKEKRDKEHAEKFKRLQAQLAREKTLDKWVFVVDKKLLAPVLRERSRFIEQPEKPEKPAPGKKK
jgi:uncharacterized protein DUF4340